MRSMHALFLHAHVCATHGWNVRLNFKECGDAVTQEQMRLLGS
jgi:hypothetical protein